MDGNYIDKAYCLSQEPGMPVDTTEICTYTYDNLKRVTKLNIMSYGFDEEEPSDPIITTFLYYYNGSDTLPYKSVYTVIEDSENSTTETSFHFYDASGRKLKDSLLILNRSEVTEYSYNGNIITGFTNNYFDPAYSYVIDTAITDVRGNIVSHKSYRYRISTMEWEPFKIVSSTYDDNENPFSKLSNFKTFNPFLDDVYYYSTFTLYKFTNILKQDGWDATILGNEWHSTYTNSFYANGKLKQVICQIEPGNLQDKWLFTYKSL